MDDHVPNVKSSKFEQIIRPQRCITARAAMLNVRGLQCVRGERTLFAALNFDLANGEWLHVRGANGAGKTSLLRLLAGLSRPEQGEITWLGTPINHPDSDYRANLLFFGHLGAIKDDLTAFENLTFASALDGLHWPPEHYLAALYRMGLQGREDLPVRVLSAGQKRRVALARLLCSKARLWILDEPFTALDVKAVELLSQLIAEHVQSGAMAVLTSHQSMPLPGGRELVL